MTDIIGCAELRHFLKSATLPEKTQPARAQFVRTSSGPLPDQRIHGPLRRGHRGFLRPLLAPADDLRRAFVLDHVMPDVPVPRVAGDFRGVRSGADAIPAVPPQVGPRLQQPCRPFAVSPLPY